MTIKLYELCGADPQHLFSPHCWKTRLSLAHKGLDFETIPTPFTEVAKLEGGGRRVPVLRVDDTVVEDSLAIAQYLDEAHPDAPSLIGDATALALTRFVINWTQTQLHPEVAKLAMLDIYKSLAPEDQKFFRTTREKAFGMTLEDFDAKFPKDGKSLNNVLVPLVLTLKNQPFIGGDTPSFADYVPFGALQWLRLCGPVQTLPQEGPVADWFNKLLDMYDGAGRKARRADGTVAG